MHRPDPIRIVRIALRLSLAAGFLSAVADRFGWWKPFGRASWGSMTVFADYTHQLVPFASGWLLTVIVWAATTTEATLGYLLLTGWRPKLVGAMACLVLIAFGLAMAISIGVEAPLSYSVFPAASAAAAYAILGPLSNPDPRDNQSVRETAYRHPNDPIRAGSLALVTHPNTAGRTDHRK